MGKVIKWSEEEVKFLKENYNKLGAEKCSEFLKNRTKSGVVDKGSKLQLTKKLSLGL